MGPIAESIVVANILPKDWTYVSLEELEHTQLNATIVKLLCNSLCEDLQEFMLENKKICRDAHLIWALLVEICVNAKWDEDEPVEECCTSFTTNIEPQSSLFKQEEGQEEGEEESQKEVVFVRCPRSGARRGLECPRRISSDYQVRSFTQTTLMQSGMPVLYVHDDDDTIL